MRKQVLLFFIAACSILILTLKSQQVFAQKTLWQIGQPDHSASEFALAPSDYKDFLKEDFGWENKFYLIGFSNPKEDWPYALPGPEDKWIGSSGTAGQRTAVGNILFGIENLPKQGAFELNIGLVDMNANHAPKMKVTVNDTSWEYQLPKGSRDNTIKGEHTDYQGKEINIPILSTILKRGGNQVSITILRGSWVLFDYLHLRGPQDTQITAPASAFMRAVE